MSVICPSELAKGVLAQGAPAGLSLRETLRRLLANTELSFDLIENRFVVIRKAEDESFADVPLEPVPGVALNDSSITGAGLARKRPLAQVIIGSHIPNTEPVGAHPTTITRKHINEHGYASVDEVIRSLPQNFSGGPSEDTYASGQEEIFNTSRGVGLNFRGLGSGSTLVLLNGRRMAAGGGDGRFVDISGIPLSAIERIDVLPDGASAIYGADAVGGVVNFELRQDYKGMEAQLKRGTATSGGPGQLQAAQTFGQTWASGNVLFSAEYYERDNLLSGNRLQSTDSDLTSWPGGSNYDIREGNPGTIISPLGTFPIPLGQDGRSLTSADLTRGTPNLHNNNFGKDLLPASRRWSLVGTFNQSLPNDWRLFSDLLLSERDTKIMLGPARATLNVPKSNGFFVSPDPNAQSVLVSYSFGRDLGREVDDARVTARSATLGLDMHAGTWTITPALTYTSARDLISAGPFVDQAALATALADPNRETAFNPFGDGSFTNPATLAKIRVDLELDRQTEVSTANIAANGTLFRWRDREIRMAAGLDRRHESLRSWGQQGTVITANLRADRDVLAYYGELYVPLISERYQRFGLNTLKLSVADRYEHYSSGSSASTPRLGLSWSPVPNLKLRGNWSESFKATNLVDLDDSRNITALATLSDHGKLAQALLWVGNNPEIEDEKANTWTLGADFKVPSRGLAFELTYFNLNYRDRVDRLEFNPNVLNDPKFSGFVNRNPTPEERQRVCNSARFIGKLEDCLRTPIAGLIDLRLGNVSSMRTDGIDFSASYNAQTRLGALEAYLSTTWLADFSKARYYTSPLESVLDTGGNPVRFRSKAYAHLDRGSFALRGQFNFTGSYTDTTTSPYNAVHPWTTLDLGIRYKTGSGTDSWLDNLGIDLNVMNVFDKRPPFYNNPLGIAYDAENADLLMRFVRVSVRKEWN